MPTLTETMREVLDHPDNYSFPVSKPEPMNSHGTAAWPQWVENTLSEPIPAYQREFMRDMERLSSEMTRFDGGLPQMLSTPFSRDSVAQRILDDNRRRIDTPLPLQNSETLYNTNCAYCSSPDRPCVPRRRSTLGMSRVRYSGEISDPDPYVYVCVPCLERAIVQPRSTPHYGLRGLTTRPFPDINGPSVDLSGAQLTREQFDEARIALQSRPDHYRARQGVCICGFKSVYHGDMEAHLARPTGGQWWTVCECGESRLCRSVRVPTLGVSPLGGHASPSAFTPVGPSDITLYLCDDCRARRGIS